MMKEQHFAYQIIEGGEGLVCTHAVLEDESMLALLQEIKASKTKGLYWVFKQLEGHSSEPLCLIDCFHQRIYYHYSGEVEDMDVMINKLTKS